MSPCVCVCVCVFQCNVVNLFSNFYFILFVFLSHQKVEKHQTQGTGLVIAPFLLQIARFSPLAGLYQQVGFQRKASFSRGVAAMWCVAPKPAARLGAVLSPAAAALGGHMLCLDPLEFRKGEGTMCVCVCVCVCVYVFT